MKKRFLKFYSLILTFIIIITITSVPKPVQASTGILKESDLKTLTQMFENHNIDKDTQKFLIEKLENGQLWDSVLGKQPIYSVKLDESTTKEIFEDGSFCITSVEAVKDEELNPYDISIGKVVTGTGYSNYTKAKVYKYLGLINCAFYADFTLIDGVGSYISRVYDDSITTIGISIKNSSLSIRIPKESYNQPAEAVLRMELASPMKLVLNSTGYLRLFVGKKTYYTDYE